MSKAVKVLQITVGGTVFTGVASFLLQYCGNIDRTKVHCDFLFCRENSMELVMDDPIFSDSQFFVLNATKKNNEMDYLLLARKLSGILKANHYDVVHINTTAVGVTVFCVMVARLCGVKTVVSHSHNVKITIKGANRRNRILQSVIDSAKQICPWLIRTACDAVFACSVDAGITLFGQKGISSKKFRVIRTAIDAEKYRFSPQTRKQIRTEQQIGEDTLVFGHVGRLAPEKNHLFMIDVFKYINRAKPDSELWLIGSGDEYDSILKKIREEGLEASVKLLGQKNDIHRYMQGMDVFLFPSITEGLGMVSIEAQAAALPVYASDAVPRDTEITELIGYLPLSAKPETWAETILNEHKWEQERTDTYKNLVESGYDVKISAKWLQEFYLSRV